MVGTSGESPGTSTVSRGAEADVGTGSVLTGLTGSKLTVAMLPRVGLSELESLALEVTGCCAFDDTVSGTRLLPLLSITTTGVCSVGVGVGVCSESNVGIDVDVDGSDGTEDVSGVLSGAELVGGTGLGLLANQGTGWSDELLVSDDGATFVSAVAGVDAGAFGTDRDCIIGDWIAGDWSSVKMVASVRDGP